MKINYNSRRVIFNELEGDTYGIKGIAQNSIKYFIDIGAAYGIVSLMARLLHPKMHITAIEPHPETFKDLVDNTDRMQIKCLNLALGNGNMFYLEKERKMRLCNSFKEEVKDTHSVQSYTLSDIVKLTGYDMSNLAIKIDCEGAEWHLLENKADEEIIVKSRLFSVEIHGDKENKFIDKFYEKISHIIEDTHYKSFVKLSPTLGVLKIWQ